MTKKQSKNSKSKVKQKNDTTYRVPIGPQGPIMYLPTHLITRVFDEVYENTILAAINSDQFDKHRCIITHPCTLLRPAVSELRRLRFVCKTWKEVFIGFKDNRFYCSRRKNDIDQVQLPKYEFDYNRYYSDDDYEHFVNTRRLAKDMRQTPAGGGILAHETLLDDSDKIVLSCWDYRGRSGCKAAKEVVLKIYKDKKVTAEFTHEQKIYKRLQRHDDQPRIKWAPKIVGHTDFLIYGKYRCLTLEKLGPSLQKMLDAKVHFTERMLMAVAIQLLRAYKDIHERKVLHNGAKPGNVTICASSTKAGDPRRSRLFFIDFGHSFTVQEGKKMPDEFEQERFTGNYWFMSGLALYRLRLSYRDDLESLSYLIVALKHKVLPWAKKTINYRHIREAKLTATAKDLFLGFDDSFVEFYDSVRRLSFNEKPKYDKLIDSFCLAWKRKGFLGKPGEVDWLDIWEDHLERKMCQVAVLDVGDTASKSKEGDMTTTSDSAHRSSLDEKGPCIRYALDSAFGYCDIVTEMESDSGSDMHDSGFLEYSKKDIIQVLANISQERKGTEKPVLEMGENTSMPNTKVNSSQLSSHRLNQSGLKSSLRFFSDGPDTEVYQPKEYHRVRMTEWERSHTVIDGHGFAKLVPDWY